MLVYLQNDGAYWYFWFEIKMADDRVKILKYKALKQM